MALEERGAERFNVTITRRPFFLYPGGRHAIRRWGERVDALYHPSASASLSELGASAGYSFDMDAPLSDTHDSHRLVLWAQRERAGLGEALAQAIGVRYFEQGQPLADWSMLAACAEEVGLDADAALGFLASEGGHDEVRESVEANRRAGVTSIPLFKFRSGEFERAVHGSADVATFARVLADIEAYWASEPPREESCAS